MDLLFISILLTAAAAQVFGGVISWFLIKKFYRSLKIVIWIEIILMLVMSLLLIEEGLKITLFTILSVLAGAALIAMFNKIIPHKHETKAKRISYLIFIAMCFHELPEGIGFGSSYLINPYLGITAAILIALHNIPEGLIVSIPYSINNKFTSGLKAVLITQALFIFGSAAAYGFLINISQQFQALTMAFAAGAMLYVIYEEFLYTKLIGK